jgi:hypothetical protein
MESSFTHHLCSHRDEGLACHQQNTGNHPYCPQLHCAWFSFGMLDARKLFITSCLTKKLHSTWRSTKKCPWNLTHKRHAGCLLASFLSSLLDALGHWYAPMLPDDHPSSFISLMAWLQASLLCHSCPGSLWFCHEAGQKQEFIQFPEWCLQWLPSIPTATFDQ